MGFDRVHNSATALKGFLRSGLLLAGALLIFATIFGVCSRRQPRIAAPKSEILDRLAEDKRQILRDNFARSIQAQHDAQVAQSQASDDEAKQRFDLSPQPSRASAHSDSEPLVSVEGEHATDPEVLKAIALIDNGQTNEAIATLESIIKRDPKNEQALVELAMIHLLDMKAPDQAINYLQRAVQITPDNQIVMSELVTLYDEQQRVDDGIAFFQELDKQQSGSAMIAYGLGQLLALSGRDAEAIPYLEKAVHQSDGMRAFHDLAETYSRLGDSEHAIDAYDRALKALEQELSSKRAQGQASAYVEERLHYTKLDKARELIRINDLDGAQRLLDDVGQQLPGDEGVMALQQHLNGKRAG